MRDVHSDADSKHAYLWSSVVTIPTSVVDCQISKPDGTENDLNTGIS